MIDYFAVLGQERRPWLDAEALKNAFHRLSAELHPDVTATGNAAKFSELNAAYSALREPATRLRHLLELTAPETLAANVPPPPSLGDFFMRYGSLKQRDNALTARQAAATSPLSRALLAGDAAALRRDFETLLRDLETAVAFSLDELRELDRRWPHPPAAELAATYQQLAYLSSWQAQAREALLRFEA